jgi:hypothetical protein
MSSEKAVVDAMSELNEDIVGDLSESPLIAYFVD